MLFDLSSVQPSNESRFHGGGDLARIWFVKFLELGLRPDVCYRIDRHVDKSVLDLVSFYKLKVLHFNTKHDIEHYCNSNKVDLFFTALPYEYGFMNFEVTKFHMVILGLRSIEMNDLKTQLSYSKSLLNQLKILISVGLFSNRFLEREKNKIRLLLSNRNISLSTISYHSKYSLLSTFPEIQKDEVNVCYATANLDVSTVVKKSNTFRILLVSSNRWIKNVKRSLEAIDELITQGLLEEVEVVVTGWDETIPLNLMNESKFLRMGYLEHDALQLEFSAARLFVYPSLNEGYGYPPLNAFRYGTPVIASGLASIPEVCQDGALYFNPFSKKEIANRILNVYHSEKLQKHLIRKGHERLKELDNLQQQHLERMVQLLKPMIGR